MCVKEPWHNRACFMAWTLIHAIQGCGALLFALAGDVPCRITASEFHAQPQPLWEIIRL
jgi:hypothetical protein